LDRIDELGSKAFEGFVVRKDLVRKYSKAYPVPGYVVEFLLGRYCASTDPAEIQEGLGIVEKQLVDRCVRTGQEEVFKNKAFKTGSVRLIDTIRARLDAKNACYIAELPSLALKDVRIDERLVDENERMLTDGFYAEITLSYDAVIAHGVHSADVVLNILARQRDPGRPANILTPAALTLRHAPIAHCARYDNLRRTI
jgi:ATP-dependent Lon protease